MSNSPYLYGGTNNEGQIIGITTAGFLKTDSSGNVSVSSSGGTPQYNIQNESTTYNAVIGDYVICSGASFTVTLPTAVGVSGQSITIKHNGTSLSQAYTLNTTSSQTINGAGGAITSGNYVLYTNGESLVLTSDNANWQVSDHQTNTLWISAGSVANFYVFTIATGTYSGTIGATYTNNSNTYTLAQTFTTASASIILQGPAAPTATGTLTNTGGTHSGNPIYTAVSGSANTVSATTTAPTFFGTPTTNSFQWMRQGSNIILLLQYYQATAGVAGSGDYIWPVPSGVTINTSVLPVYTGGTAQTAQGATPANMTNLWPANISGWAEEGGEYWQPIVVAPYSTTSYRIYGLYNTSSQLLISLGSSFIPASTVLTLTWQITLPVQGWQP